jgi:hypothetical protein
MDHQAFAQMLGNYGEFLGAILLVGSLVYVGVQVRHNTAVSKAQIYQARADAAQEMFMFLAGKSDLAEIYLKVLDNGVFDEAKLSELSGLDAQKLRYMESAHQQRIDNLYYQYQHGFLDEEYWSMVNSTLPKLMRRWQTLSIKSVRASFKEELDRSHTGPASSVPPF